MTESGRIRVLSFTTLFPNPLEPARGVFVRNRLAALSRLVDLTVVAPVNAGRRPEALFLPPRRLDPEGFVVHHPRFAVLPGVGKEWDAAILFREAWPQVRRSLDGARIDLVDAHYAYPDGAAAARIADRFRRPLVLTVRGSDLEVLPRDERRRPEIVRTLLRADAVVAVSASLERRAAELGAAPERVHEIGNGVDLAAFTPSDRSSARRTLGLSDEERTVLAVGRLDPVKGLDLLVAAAAPLRARLGESLRIRIVGAGPARAALERAIRTRGLEETVRLEGEVSPAALGTWYASAEVVALLSHSEGCPNVVIEALACGRPVVATRVGGVPELIRDGENGFLVDRRDPSDVADRLHRALVRDWNPEALAATVRSRSWDDVARRQEALFRSLLDRA